MTLISSRPIKILVVLLITLFAHGCASIMYGKEQTITINSNPSDATIIIYDINKNREIIKTKTPYTLQLRRGNGYFRKARYQVTFIKDGYSKEEITVKGKVNGWYLGGNLFSGLIGYFFVDPLTGAMWTLEPDELNVQLTRTNITASSHLFKETPYFYELHFYNPKHLQETVFPISLSWNQWPAIMGSEFPYTKTQVGEVL